MVLVKKRLHQSKKGVYNNINYMLHKKPLELSPTGWAQYDNWLPNKFSTSRARTQAIILAKAQIRMKESKRES